MPSSSRKKQDRLTCFHQGLLSKDCVAEALARWFFRPLYQLQQDLQDDDLHEYCGFLVSADDVQLQTLHEKGLAFFFDLTRPAAAYPTSARTHALTASAPEAIALVP